MNATHRKLLTDSRGLCRIRLGLLRMSFNVSEQEVTTLHKCLDRTQCSYLYCSAAVYTGVARRSVKHGGLSYEVQEWTACCAVPSSWLGAHYLRGSERGSDSLRLRKCCRLRNRVRCLPVRGVSGTGRYGLLQGPIGVDAVLCSVTGRLGLSMGSGRSDRVGE
jgi:hypothetical protein